MQKIIKELIPYIIILIVVILFRTFIATPVVVKGESMLPNLVNNEVLILNKLSYNLSKIERFDIVVLDESKLKEYAEDKLIIKRIIGLPGEIVEYKNDVLYIDGKELDDDYSDNKTKDFTLEGISGYDVIPDNKYLVLGDNRSVSKDSRMIGLIDKDDIKGKASFRIFPFKKFGSLK